MKNSDIVSIVDYALSGNNIQLINFIKKIAIESNNSGKHNLYSSLDKILQKYQFGNVSRILPSSVSDHFFPNILQIPENIWFSRSVEAKVESFIKIHSSMLGENEKKKVNKLLLYGPPGTGKTTLGFYIAKKLGYSLNYVQLSNIISSRFGETMKNISNIFQSTNEKIIFIDEFDAFAKTRLDSNDVGELKRIVNSLIQTLDFYSSNKITIVATNMVNTLDPAILRRFSFKILVNELDKDEITNFFDHLTRSLKKPVVIISDSEKKILLNLIINLNIRTVDQVQQLFDKAIILSKIQKSKKVGIPHFIESLIMMDIFDKNSIKNLHRVNPNTLKNISNLLKKLGYSNANISEILRIHRNTLREYVKKI